MHFVYGFCDGNSCRAKAEYHLCYPLCFVPNHAVFAAIHQKLRETGSFGKVCEMGHNQCSATIEEYIVDQVEENPNVNSRILPRESGISQSKVMNVLHENLHYPYHFTTGTTIMSPRFQKTGNILSRVVRARY